MIGRRERTTTTTNQTHEISNNQHRNLLIFPYEFLSDFQALKLYIVEFDKQNIPMVLKDRPSTDGFAQGRTFYKDLVEMGITNMQYVQDLDQKLSKEGIIVGCHSTMLYEALDDDVPIWYLPDTRCVMLSGIIPQSFHCLTLEFCRTQALKDYESLWAPKKNSLPHPTT